MPSADQIRRQSYGNCVEQLADRHCIKKTATHGFSPRWRTIPQFLSSGQIRVPECRRLTLVAKLFKSISLERSPRGMVGLSKDEVVEHLHHPPIIALIKRFLRSGHHCIGPAGKGDIARAHLGRRQAPEVCRISVVPRQIPLVHRFHIVNEMAVVPSGMPLR